MAVFTHITREELASHLALYDIGEATGLSGISDGIENTNYRVETPQEIFILTIFESRIRREDLPFCLGFMAHLGAAGVPVARIVPAKTGDIVLTLKGKPSVITTFLPGKGVEEISAAHCSGFGELVARMHVAGDGFGLRRDNAMGLPEWRRLIAAAGAPPELAEELDFLSTRMPRGLPQGAVHADLFPDNVFFHDGRVSGVIDFYFSCTDFYAYDLMLAFNAWCFGKDGLPDKARAAALMESYTRVRPLAAAEVESLPVLGRAAALRIVATRLYDSLHPRPGQVTPKDPEEHMRILRFHRRASALRDYGLAA